MNSNADKGKLKYMDFNDINLSNINKLRDNKEEKSNKDLYKEHYNKDDRDNKGDFNIQSVREALGSQNYNNHSSSFINSNGTGNTKDKDISKFELVRKLEAKLNCPVVNTKEQEPVYSRQGKNIKDFQSQSIVSSNNNPITLEYFDVKNSSNLNKRIEKLK